MDNLSFIVPAKTYTLFVPESYIMCKLYTKQYDIVSFLCRTTDSVRFYRVWL